MFNIEHMIDNIKTEFSIFIILASIVIAVFGVYKAVVLIKNTTSNKK